MDGRTDPVEIIARVGGVPPYTEYERAFDTWVHLARKAGWQVVADVSADGERGVDVEGLRYVIRYGPRVRVSHCEVVDGRMVERDALAVAAWAEPVVSERSAPDW